MIYELTSVEGDRNLTLPPDRTVVVGRSISCDLVIDDPTVSRRHAELSLAEGGLMVRDLGSSNGTFIDDNRVGMALVSPGDRIVFGTVAFRFIEVKPAAPVQAAPVQAAPVQAAPEPAAPEPEPEPAAPEPAAPRGGRYTAAVLFCEIRVPAATAAATDIDDFTARLAETLRTVAAHGGVLGRFAGDSIMALWGIPTARPDDAVTVLETVTALRDVWCGDAGIALHVGEVLACPVGVEYVALGAAVDAAARLAARAEGGEVLLSHAFCAALPSPPAAEPLDPVYRLKR